MVKNREELNSIQMMLETPLSKEELYDLHKDTFQIHNLIGDLQYRDQHKEMREVLDKWHEKIDDKGMDPMNPAARHYFSNYKSQSKVRYRSRINEVRNKVETKMGIQY